MERKVTGVTGTTPTLTCRVHGHHPQEGAAPATQAPTATIE
jgi:hypothetical protein